MGSRGATWVYHATITNGAGGAGNQIYTVSPGDSNEMEVMYGFIHNGDATTRTIDCRILDGASGNFLSGYFDNETLLANQNRVFPDSDTNKLSPFRVLVSGDAQLFMRVRSVAASQDSEAAVVCRVRGRAPTTTEDGASSPTTIINTARFF